MNPDGSRKILNTASNYFYTATFRRVCTKAHPNGRANPTQLPWLFVTIDQAASIDGSGESPDSNILSTKYFHDKQAYISHGVSMPSEQVYWYVLFGTVSSGNNNQMVETSCQQTYGASPGDGGDSTSQSGDRDFSTNYSVSAGSYVHQYTIPQGMVCEDQQLERGQVQSLAGFGPVIF